MSAIQSMRSNFFATDLRNSYDILYPPLSRSPRNSLECFFELDAASAPCDVPSRIWERDVPGLALPITGDDPYPGQAAVQGRKPLSAPFNRAGTPEDFRSPRARRMRTAKTLPKGGVDKSISRNCRTTPTFACRSNRSFSDTSYCSWPAGCGKRPARTSFPSTCDRQTRLSRAMQKSLYTRKACQDYWRPRSHRPGQ